MSLSVYRRKRRFRRTPEPRGAARRRRPRGRLSYFIQRHAARRLHYDFRLELDGVLKSWAVPKGPSSDPRERRLAVHVEDHPLEYGTFEGRIPEGEYGAGDVELWDRGDWIPDGDPREAYRRGRLKFHLHGRKLHGGWTLVRMSGPRSEDGKNWLLIKEGDEELPRRVEPELATLAERTPAGDEWLHEIKLDGYRILAEVSDGRVVLRSRRGNDWTDRFSAIAGALKGLSAEQALLDGEVVSLDEQGRSSFQDLQNALSEGRGERLVYYVFDLLHLDGRDWREEPLSARKAALETLLRETARRAREPFSGRVRFTDHLVGDGERMFRRACEIGLEGVVSKRKDSPYHSGRSPAWLKVKCVHEQEFVIAGWSAPGSARSGFGALLLAARKGRGFTYAGRVGTGFTEASLRELRRKLRSLETDKRPFSRLPSDADVRGVRWVRPALVAEIEFRGWTREGILRQASFKGLREDKPAEEVVVERAAPSPQSASGNAERDRVAGIRLTHPDRAIDPELGLTKRELALYYERVAERLLPHVADRPLAVLRCPEGRGKPCFYQKHLGDAFPEAVHGVRIEEKRGVFAECLSISDVAGLVSLVQVGVLELHPWGCRVDDLERPDRMIFDLDPSREVPWTRMIAAAREVRERLTALKLGAFLKTTGGKGLHVVVPLKPESEWPRVKAFAKAFAELMAQHDPRRFTARLPKAGRAGKIFVDYLRNERGATAVAPYSTRARPGAPVSMPIEWDELVPSLKSDRFNVADAARRLASRDPWRDYESARRPLPLK